MKTTYISIIVFASVALYSARGTEKKEEPEQTNKTVTFDENNQPIHINKTLPPKNKPNHLRRFPTKEKKPLDSGSYGNPSTETKNTTQTDSSDKK